VSIGFVGDIYISGLASCAGPVNGAYDCGVKLKYHFVAAAAAAE